MIKIVSESHVDHGLRMPQLLYVLERAEANAEPGHVAVLTVLLPTDLGPATCALYGPAMGDEPIADDRVRLARRGDRSGESRMLDAPLRETSRVTVIVGPHGDDGLVLYTAFGGPSTPREPWDPSLGSAAERAASVEFWSQHALATGEA